MIVYTRHTEQRLIERRINRAWIDATIMSPDWTTSDPDPTLTRSYKAIKPQAVVYSESCIGPMGLIRSS